MRFAERHVPGATFAPTTAYVSVASRLLVGRRVTDDGLESFVRRQYEDVYPQPHLDAVAGDGLIPLEAALLPGSRQVVLPDAIHGPASRAPWYGTDADLDAWWPVALDAWRGALRARLAAGPAPVTVNGQAHRPGRSCCGGRRPERWRPQAAGRRHPPGHVADGRVSSNLPARVKVVADSTDDPPRDCLVTPGTLGPSAASPA